MDKWWFVLGNTKTGFDQEVIVDDCLTNMVVLKAVPKEKF